MELLSLRYAKNRGGGGEGKTGRVDGRHTLLMRKPESGRTLTVRMPNLKGRERGEECNEETRGGEEDNSVWGGQDWEEGGSDGRGDGEEGRWEEQRTKGEYFICCERRRS